MTALKVFLGAALVLSASAFTCFQSVDWKVKEDYSVKCVAGLECGFKGLKATIFFDEAHPERSGISASIRAATVNSGNTLKDTHIKEGLNTDRFPLISFVSTAINKKGTVAGEYEVTGRLTIKDITKEITFPFYFNSQKASSQFPFVDKNVFNGKFTIVSKDFNLTRMGTPDQVSIELNIPVSK